MLQKEPNNNTSLSIAANIYRILSSGKDNHGASAVIDMLVLPGGGPVAHGEFLAKTSYP